MITQQLVKQVTKEQQPNKIYKIDLSNRLLTRISSLRPFSKLRYLQLNFNMIKSIENLQMLTDLRQLHLANNQISEIQRLDNNKSLTVLDLSNNQIKKIENIGHLIKLETLIIDQNCIQKITGMEGLKDLKNLSMNSNKLISIDSLPAFSKLESLSAENNKIKKISSKVFGNTKNKLSRLNLSKNQLKQVPFLHMLGGLQYLDLSQNNISAFPPEFESQTSTVIFKNLQYINISYNCFESLPKINEKFPELTVLLLSNNFIQAEYEIIRAIAQADYLLEIDFRDNPMFTEQFSQTLYRIYGIDRINNKDFSNKPGSRYYQQGVQIRKGLNSQLFSNIEDDEQDRKIKMSGFYNQQIETQLTGMKPNRPSSPRKSKAIMNLNYDDFKKTYQEIKKNDDKIDNLRRQCLQIFSRNNIIPPDITMSKSEISELKQYEKNNKQEQTKNTEESPLVTQVKIETDTKVLEMKKMNEQQSKKWKQLKNKQKNFNIRGARRGSGSQRKPATLDGSESRFPPQDFHTTKDRGGQLMKTQVNPTRWSNDPNMMKTIGYRPLSAKKKIN